VSFAAITLCVTSQSVFLIAVVYFVIGSVRKLLDTPSYFGPECWVFDVQSTHVSLLHY